MKNKKILFAVISLVLIVLAILVFSLILNGSLFQKTKYYTGNFHTHTVASDGHMTYQEVIETAKALGFDFIAITDHDTVAPETALLCPVEKRILCIVGEEVSSSDGHILAIDIKNAIPQSLSAEETINMIHQQGGIAIVAHPGRSNGGLSMEKIKGLDADAVECSLSSKTDDKYNCEFLPEFPRVYDSDAHQKTELSRLANRCLFFNLNINSVETAVREGNCFEFKSAVAP